MEKKLIEKLKSFKNEQETIENSLNDPANFSDAKKITTLNKKLKKINPVVDLFNTFIKNEKDLNEALELSSNEKDAEMIVLLKETITNAKKNILELEEKIKELLVEKDPLDEKDAFMEIQGAAGGDEAKIFAGDLYNMYLHYCSKKGWKVNVMNYEESDSGGYSSISLEILGDDVYKFLKYESGVHRVQRVPQTESQGRVHTSTAMVSITPITNDSDDVDEIDPKDIRIDTYRSGGKGGQHANKTDSAVRITHVPSGIVVQSQDGRSQHDNKSKAMYTLKIKLSHERLQKEQSENASKKKTLVGTGDRSEKIRTYNYPQNRITDHRIGFSLKKLDRIITGEGLDELIEKLIVMLNEGENEKN